MTPFFLLELGKWVVSTLPHIVDQFKSERPELDEQTIPKIDGPALVKRKRVRKGGE
jgi:hypothetical protein